MADQRERREASTALRRMSGAALAFVWASKRRNEVASGLHRTIYAPDLLQLDIKFRKFIRNIVGIVGGAHPLQLGGIRPGKYLRKYSTRKCRNPMHFAESEQMSGPSQKKNIRFMYNFFV